MLPHMPFDTGPSQWRLRAGRWVAALFMAVPVITTGSGAPSASVQPEPAAAPVAASCLLSGDGYLHARLGGALDKTIDWPNSGTRCQGENRREPPGVRLSFQRDPAGRENLLFVFGLTGVREGQPAHEIGTNLTVIVQGTSKIYGTQGDSRCTVDSLTQRPTTTAHAYRLEARGFCTQPAHAVRGSGAVLVSTFDFAGVVTYDAADDAAGAPK
jgi:hypothetical protein